MSDYGKGEDFEIAIAGFRRQIHRLRYLAVKKYGPKARKWFEK